MGQNQQNLRHHQTAISQARNKLLINFERLGSTTRHGHMRYLSVSPNIPEMSQVSSNSNAGNTVQVFII